MEIMNTSPAPYNPPTSLTMWFIKRLQVWRAQLANRKKKGATHPPTKRMLCVEELRRLTPEWFLYYRPEAGLGVYVKVCYPNIDAYAQALREFADLIKEERPISPTQVKEADTVLTLDRFLTSADGFYLDVVAAVAKYKACALHLCEALEAGDYAEHGLPEHNLRMLTKLFSNVLTLTSQLNDVRRDV